MVVTTTGRQSIFVCDTNFMYDAYCKNLPQKKTPQLHDEMHIS